MSFLSRSQEYFLEVLNEHGGRECNHNMIAALEWDREFYDAVKASLVANNCITLGRGRGGTVKIVQPTNDEVQNVIENYEPRYF